MVRKAYNKTFILADIHTPIVGWDFIKPNQEGFKRHIEKKEDFQIGFGGKLIRICLLSLLSSLKVELFCIKSWFTIF